MIPLQLANRHPVTHLLFNPDGSAIAAFQPHTGVTVLDRATGQALAVCAMPKRAALTGLVFCGKYLVAAHLKGLEVFDATTGAAVVRHYHYPQGRQLAANGDTIFGATPESYTALRAVA